MVDLQTKYSKKSNKTKLTTTQVCATL